jgi:uncharacterized membrane protein
MGLIMRTTSMLKALVMVVLSALASFSDAFAGSLPTYAVIDLGALPGGTSSYAYSINASGQVVGSVRGSFP